MSVLEKIKKMMWMRSGGAYLDHLRTLGMKIGDNCELFSSPINAFIDPSRPFLIEIGNNVKITRGVTILTHGYDWSVLNGVYGNILGSSGKVKIGNNVFIGMNTTILKGTVIGDNTIIGANSLISGEWPANSVIAGNPCRRICSLDEYNVKRKDAQLRDAIELAKEYKKATGNIPPKEVFHEFFWLFSNRNDTLPECFEKMMNTNDNKKNTYKAFLDTKPQFDNYEEFIKYCFKDKE